MSTDNKPKHIVAKPIREVKVREVSNRETWAMICYYYPQYTLEEASRLNSRDIRLLLKTARRLNAKKLQQLLQVVTAPHTDKGRGVQELHDLLQNDIDE